MEVTSLGVDPEWHESLLLIQVMNTRPVPRRELFNLVREQQSKKKVLGAQGITHSRSAYAYWLNDHIDYRIAVEGEGQPRLTALGKWIADSQICTLDDRYLFVCKLTCSHCRKEHGRMVFLKLDRGTATINAKGKVCMDTQCPRCGRCKNQAGLFGGFSIDQLISLYDRALPELRNVVRDMPEVVLPDSP